MSDNIPEFSVSELSGKLKKTVEDAFGYVRVRGELGRVSRHSSGHVYLDMKDDRSVLASVIWKGVASRLRIAPEQGMEVIATGRLTTFPGQSKYQMVIESLEPAGAGALMALFEERKNRLAAEGLFDPARKQPLPFLPRVVGVVTSPTGAVIRDILHRLRDRFPVHVVVWPTAVQGDRAAPQIIAGIRGFNAAAAGIGPVPRPDVLIVARGGGSLEDLWCFNDEGVARAVAQSAIPVISAVGHETDTTLIDFVADRRAPTPSAAAEMAVPVRSELLDMIDGRGRRLIIGLTRLMEGRGLALQAASRGLGRPEALLDTATQRVDRATDRLQAAQAKRLERLGGRMAAVKAALRPAQLVQRARADAQRLSRAGGQLVRAPGLRLERLTSRLQSARLPSAGLVRHVDMKQRHVDGLSPRLARASYQSVAAGAQRLEQTARLLDSLSYRGVLARGYVLVLNDEGLPMRSATALVDDETVSLRFHDGDRGAVIGGTPGSAKKKSRKPAGPQSSLFD